MKIFKAFSKNKNELAFHFRRDFGAESVQAAKYFASRALGGDVDIILREGDTLYTKRGRSWVTSKI